MIGERRAGTRAAPRVSVVIPTFNGAARLPRVLAALAAQDAPGVPFEVIAVDNASTDETGLVIERDPAAAAMAARGIVCRTVHEARQGVLFARIKGVREAAAPLICFIDDDNLAEPDYIAQGLGLFTDRSIAMAIARVDAKWEAEPPASVRRRRHLLAVNDYNGDSAIEFHELIAPTITAGMWVCREAFLTTIPWQTPERLMTGRVGTALGGGEDIEFGILFAKAGHRRVYAPALRILHEIPRTRFEVGYMRRLIRGTIRTELALTSKYVKPYGRSDRMMAWMRFVSAVCAIPGFPLFKTDWRREAAFVMADRYARLRGPIGGA